MSSVNSSCVVASSSSSSSPSSSSVQSNNSHERSIDTNDDNNNDNDNVDVDDDDDTDVDDDDHDDDVEILNPIDPTKADADNDEYDTNDDVSDTNNDVPDANNDVPDDDGDVSDADVSQSHADVSHADDDNDYENDDNDVVNVDNANHDDDDDDDDDEHSQDESHTEEEQVGGKKWMTRYKKEDLVDVLDHVVATGAQWERYARRFYDWNPNNTNTPKTSNAVPGPELVLKDKAKEKLNAELLLGNNHVEKDSKGLPIRRSKKNSIHLFYQDRTKKLTLLTSAHFEDDRIYGVKDKLLMHSQDWGIKKRKAYNKRAWEQEHGDGIPLVPFSEERLSKRPRQHQQQQKHEQQQKQKQNIDPPHLQRGKKQKKCVYEKDLDLADIEEDDMETTVPIQLKQIPRQKKLSKATRDVRGQVTYVTSTLRPLKRESDHPMFDHFIPQTLLHRCWHRALHAASTTIACPDATKDDNHTTDEHHVVTTNGPSTNASPADAPTVDAHDKDKIDDGNDGLGEDLSDRNKYTPERAAVKCQALNIMLPDDEDPQLCPSCQIIFDSPSQLVRHFLGTGPTSSILPSTSATMLPVRGCCWRLFDEMNHQLIEEALLAEVKDIIKQVCDLLEREVMKKEMKAQSASSGTAKKKKSRNPPVVPLNWRDILQMLSAVVVHSKYQQSANSPTLRVQDGVPPLPLNAQVMESLLRRCVDRYADVPYDVNKKESAHLTNSDKIWGENSTEAEAFFDVAAFCEDIWW